MRWTDERLDDLAASLKEAREQIKAIADIRTEMAALRSEVRNTGEDASVCRTELGQLKRDLEKRAQVQHDERKADRRWMIGTLLATASLITAALAVFIG